MGKYYDFIRAVGKSSKNNRTNFITNPDSSRRLQGWDFSLGDNGIYRIVTIIQKTGVTEYLHWNSISKKEIVAII